MVLLTCSLIHWVKWIFFIPSYRQACLDLEMPMAGPTFYLISYDGYENHLCILMGINKFMDLIFLTCKRMYQVMYTT